MPLKKRRSRNRGDYWREQPLESATRAWRTRARLDERRSCSPVHHSAPGQNLHHRSPVIIRFIVSVTSRAYTPQSPFIGRIMRPNVADSNSKPRRRPLPLRRRRGQGLRPVDALPIPGAEVRRTGAWDTVFPNDPEQPIESKGRDALRFSGFRHVGQPSLDQPATRPRSATRARLSSRPSPASRVPNKMKNSGRSRQVAENKHPKPWVTLGYPGVTHERDPQIPSLAAPHAASASPGGLTPVDPKYKIVPDGQAVPGRISFCSVESTT